MSDRISPMSDPVTRAARRQNAADRVAEHLTDWGCPADTAAARAALILDTIERQGWHADPTPPPLRGRGSTDEGRARARHYLANTLAGCVCPETWRGLPAAEHPDACPVRPVAAIPAPRRYPNNPPDPFDAATGL